METETKVEEGASCVILSDGWLAGDGVEVIDAGGILSSPREYEREDMESMVERLEAFGWPSVAADVRQRWEEANDGR